MLHLFEINKDDVIIDVILNLTFVVPSEIK